MPKVEKRYMRQGLNEARSSVMSGIGQPDSLTKLRAKAARERASYLESKRIEQNREQKERIRRDFGQKYQDLENISSSQKKCSDIMQVCTPERVLKDGTLSKQQLDVWQSSFRETEFK